jgi:hypothetical protein
MKNELFALLVAGTLTIPHITPALKQEYWTLSERRFGYLETVKREQAVWNGRGT